MPTNQSTFEKLVNIIAELRNPDSGCPWDLKQTHHSLKKYALEEVYELVEAIDIGPNELKEELGDVLLQVLLHSQIASDNGDFKIEDVVAALCKKMISRHPHVFGDVKAKNAEEAVLSWDAAKVKEKPQQESLLDGLPKGVAALVRAEKLGSRAAKVGFDWSTADQVFDKIDEEIAEVKEAIETGNGLEEELGDLFFAVSQLCRKLKINSESSLISACAKFERRFRWMEQQTDLEQLSTDQLEDLWESSKKESSTISGK